MKLLQVIIFSIFFQSSLPQEELNVYISGDIPKIRQPKSMDCWITVATMLVSWREQKVYSVEELAGRLGSPWDIYFETNAGLSAQDQSAFVERLGLREEPPANYTIGAYADFLKSFGPIWIITGNGSVAHARILVGLEGSGDYGGTNFILIDPARGEQVEQESLVFLREFEEEARAANDDGWEGLRIQVYHY